MTDTSLHASGTQLHPNDDGARSLPVPLRLAAACHAAPLTWTRDAGGHRLAVPLPAMPAGTLCVPSLVLRTCTPIAYRMTLICDHLSVPLAPIATAAGAARAQTPASTQLVEAQGEAVRGGLDCFETASTLRGARLELVLEHGAPSDVAGLLISHRPVRMTVADDGGDAAPLAVPERSQLDLATDIARHACSPTSIAMVLAAGGADVDAQALARACTHPDYDRLLGMWPLNLAVAARHGFGGWVRTFTSTTPALAALRAGHALVTSIRYDADALPGAPLPRTGGHLVVLRGLDARHAYVNDPAADAASVARRYPRAAFLDAWLGDRGVAYQLWPFT